MREPARSAYSKDHSHAELPKKYLILKYEQTRVPIHLRKAK